MMSSTVVTCVGNKILKINSVMLDVKRTAGIASGVNLANLLHTGDERGFTLTWKPRPEVTRNPIEWHQLPHIPRNLS